MSGADECITVSSDDDDDVEFISPKRIRLDEGREKLARLKDITSNLIPAENVMQDNINGNRVIEEGQSNKRNNSDDSLTIVIQDNQGDIQTDRDRPKEAVENRRGTSPENYLATVDEEEKISGSDISSHYENEALAESLPIQAIFQEFKNACLNSLKNSDYEEKLLPKIKKFQENFQDFLGIVGNETTPTAALHSLLETELDSAKSSAHGAVISFEKAYSHVREIIQQNSIEIPEGKAHIIDKLESKMRKIRRRIKCLEEMEVNFEDGENSSYLQLDRYQDRMVKIYELYCKMIKQDPNQGRKPAITVTASKFSEINKAVKKCYKKGQVPTYNDVQKRVQQCVRDNNLLLSEIDIECEAKKCFEQIGNLLQKLRRRQLYEIHRDYIDSTSDPAQSSTELENTLNKSQNLGKQKMDEILEKYTKMQQVNITVSEDENSEESHDQDSDDEN